MRQFLLVTILLITTSLGFAQTTTPNPPSGATQPSVPDATTPAVNQVPANPGDAPVTPSSATGPTTPSVTFDNSSPSAAGASNATPGNQAGATNSTLQPTVTAPPAASTAATANNNQTGGRGLSAGASDSAWAISMETTSVAEASRKARVARANRKPRVFTNADIARLRDRDAVSVVGPTSAPVANEQTMPASDVPEEAGPTTPVAPGQTAPPAANQPVPPGAPKSPFGAKPSPTQPR